MKTSQRNFLLATLLILVAASVRVFTYEMHALYNLAPIAAIGLFSGAILKDKRLAYIFPLMAMLLGDLYFQFFTHNPGFYGIGQFFTYAGLLAAALLGTKMGKVTVPKVAGFAVAGSLLFFLVSNFGVWVDQFFYPVKIYTTNLAGLIDCYIKAIPFSVNTFAGDLIFSGVLFTSYYLMEVRKTPVLVKA